MADHMPFAGRAVNGVSCRLCIEWMRFDRRWISKIRNCDSNRGEAGSHHLFRKLGDSGRDFSTKCNHLNEQWAIQQHISLDEHECKSFLWASSFLFGALQPLHSGLSISKTLSIKHSPCRFNSIEDFWISANCALILARDMNFVYVFAQIKLFYSKITHLFYVNILWLRHRSTTRWHSLTMRLFSIFGSARLKLYKMVTV